jgi:hypothetical protein
MLPVIIMPGPKTETTSATRGCAAGGSNLRSGFSAGFAVGFGCEK